MKKCKRRELNVKSESLHEAEVLRGAIKAVLKELDLATLRTLLRAIRYAEEGKTPVAVTLEDLRDPWQRRILLEVYGAGGEGAN
jgi:hypothetical protein